MTSTDADRAKDAAGTSMIYRMVPPLIHSFIEATRQIKSHPIYGSFKSDSCLQPSAKVPFLKPKPKPKPAQQSELELAAIEFGFPACKVQLAMRRNPGLTDAHNERHLNGLVEAVLALDDGDVELRKMEEEQMAAAIQSTSAAAAATDAAAVADPLPPASDPIMMKFFGLSAALRYCLSSQGLWDNGGRGDVGMLQAVLASVFLPVIASVFWVSVVSASVILVLVV